MSVHDVLVERLQRSIGLYRDLVASIPESALGRKLPNLPSSTVGQQLWCVVGARESYSRAIGAGRWDGFSCSLSAAQCNVQADVTEGLARSGAAILSAVAHGDAMTDDQYRLALDLLEHEAAHQGQLIRYLYGLKLAIPDSWRSRYALG